MRNVYKAATSLLHVHIVCVTSQSNIAHFVLISQENLGNIQIRLLLIVHIVIRLRLIRYFNNLVWRHLYGTKKNRYPVHFRLSILPRIMLKSHQTVFNYTGGYQEIRMYNLITGLWFELICEKYLRVAPCLNIYRMYSLYSYAGPIVIGNSKRHWNQKRSNRFTYINTYIISLSSSVIQWNWNEIKKT